MATINPASNAFATTHINVEDETIKKFPKREGNLSRKLTNVSSEYVGYEAQRLSRRRCSSGILNKKSNVSFLLLYEHGCLTLFFVVVQNFSNEERG